MAETWRCVGGYEGFYEVSNLGRVRSLNRTVISTTGISQRRKGKLLATRVISSGYEAVVLFKAQKLKNLQVHRLVAQAFIPNPQNFPFVLHLDDNKRNNKATNLRWGSHQHNMQDMVSKGRQVQGTRSRSAKLTESDVTEIRKLLSQGWVQTAIACKFNVNQTVISAINTGKTWFHLA